MLRRYGIYIALLLSLFGVVVYLEIVKPKEADWTLYFTRNADTAYGCYLLHENLPVLFPDQQVRVTHSEAKFVLGNANDEIKNYIFVNEFFNPDTIDSKSLLSYVSRGNNVFIAANHFDGYLADHLSVDTYNRFTDDDYYFDPTDEADFESYGTLQSSLLNFDELGVRVDTAYYYKRNLTNYYFTSTGSGQVDVLGRDEFDAVNFIRLKVGDGYFYLHCLPRAFSNYFVSDPVNHEYAFKALSYLPVAPTYWDEFYKIDRGPSAGSLRFVMQQPPLKWALLILLGVLLTFTIFHAKRRQRIIPVVSPLKNTTLEFVGIIARLYYNKGNHKIMSDKKIQYFLEHLRTHYQVKTLEFDDEFIRRITVRSGLPRDQIKALFDYIHAVSQMPNVEANDLHELNKSIEDFIKYSKR